MPLNVPRINELMDGTDNIVQVSELNHTDCFNANHYVKDPGKDNCFEIDFLPNRKKFTNSLPTHVSKVSRNN
jgi:hypothetical protein